METAVRIALVGAGGFATDAHLPAIAATPDLALAAVYSRSHASASALADAAKHSHSHSHAPADTSLSIYSDDNEHGNGGLDALLARPDIDAVALCLPIPLQPAVIRRCLQAGKHVLSEKPIAPSLDQARQLVAEYERDHAPLGRQWLVAEQFPYAAAWEKARTVVRDGKIGHLVGFDAQVFIQPSLKAGATNWRRVPDYQGGFLLDGGVHFVAALRHVLPAPITALSAHVTQLNPDLPPADTLRAVLHTEDRQVAGTLTLSFGTPLPSDVKVYTFRGTKGVLTVDLASPRTHLLRLTTSAAAAPAAASDAASGGVDDALPHSQVEIELAARGAVEAEFAAFAACIRAGPASAPAAFAQARSGPRAAIRDLAAIEAALTSGDRGGERVDLRELVGDGAWEVK
ncbi:hypothetical protein JCM3770_005594 [Rhodotorula araucariae]